MCIPSELDHLAVPINFLAEGKIQMVQASFEPGSYALPLRRIGSAEVGF